MRTVVAAFARSGVLGHARHVEPERQRLAHVRARAGAEAAELVRGVLRRIVVVTARRVGEYQRPGAPRAPEPGAEVRTVCLERHAPADVARRLALVVAAHAVHASHPELLARHQDILGLLP